MSIHLEWRLRDQENDIRELKNEKWRVVQLEGKVDSLFSELQHKLQEQERRIQEQSSEVSYLRDKLDELISQIQNLQNDS